MDYTNWAIGPTQTHLLLHGVLLPAPPYDLPPPPYFTKMTILL